MAWTSPRTWVSGEVPTAATFNTHVRDNLKVFGDAWGSYTPTLTGWTLGNGTLAGYYLQAGQLVIGRIEFTFGSTSSTSGNLRISLPTAVTPSVCPLGRATLLDTSTSTRYFRQAFSSSSTVMQLATEADVRVDATTPFTWATGDSVVAPFLYEAA